jgi:di/tricarboxylate transporter
VILPAVVALPMGFVGLALAAENEPNMPAAVLILFSPGLKLAELVSPEQHGSLGSTFGWFLRVGIATNAAYYFVIFFLLAYLFTRRSGRVEE